MKCKARGIPSAQEVCSVNFPRAVCITKSKEPFFNVGDSVLVLDDYYVNVTTGKVKSWATKDLQYPASDLPRSLCVPVSLEISNE